MRMAKRSGSSANISLGGYLPKLHKQGKVYHDPIDNELRKAMLNTAAAVLHSALRYTPMMGIVAAAAAPPPVLQYSKHLRPFVHSPIPAPITYLYYRRLLSLAPGRLR